MAENNQAFLFLMDYTGQTRVKIWGTAEVVDNDPRLVKHLTDPDYKGKPERAIRFHVEAWDINCRQHIQPRFTKQARTIFEKLGVSNGFPIFTAKTIACVHSIESIVSRHIDRF